MGGLFAPEQLTEDRERGSMSGTKLLLLTFDCFRNSLCRDPALGGKWCVRSQVEGVREGSVALCLFSLAGPTFHLLLGTASEDGESRGRLEKF